MEDLLRRLIMYFIIIGSLILSASINGQTKTNEFSFKLNGKKIKGTVTDLLSHPHIYGFAALDKNLFTYEVTDAKTGITNIVYPPLKGLRKDEKAEFGLDKYSETETLTLSVVGEGTDEKKNRWIIRISIELPGKKYLSKLPIRTEAKEFDWKEFDKKKPRLSITLTSGAKAYNFFNAKAEFNSLNPKEGSASGTFEFTAKNEITKEELKITEGIFTVK